MNATELLAAARELVDRADAATAGMWPRAAALLARQSLEAAMAELWLAKQPAVGSCSMRAQLLSLSTALTAPSAVRRARHAYSVLSRACHHFAYELAPSADELRAWIDEVEHVIEACLEATPSVAEARRAGA